jgi:Holliday junction resolvase RusA-like endonuclease
VKFTVEGEPVPKARPRLGRNGNTFTPEATKRGEAHVQECCFVANPKLRPVEGNIKLVAVFYCGALGRSDLDNLLKLQLDALNGVVWLDDRQVTEIQARLATFQPDPRSEIEVWLTAIPA